MKDNYEKPEIITEDISIAFAGQCCPEGYTHNTPESFEGPVDCGVCPWGNTDKYAL